MVKRIDTIKQQVKTTLSQYMKANYEPKEKDVLDKIASLINFADTNTVTGQAFKKTLEQVMSAKQDQPNFDELIKKSARISNNIEKFIADLKSEVTIDLDCFMASTPTLFQNIDGILSLINKVNANPSQIPNDNLEPSSQVNKKTKKTKLIPLTSVASQTCFPDVSPVFKSLSCFTPVLLVFLFCASFMIYLGLNHSIPM